MPHSSLLVEKLQWDDESVFIGNGKCLYVISVAGGDAPEHGTGDKKEIFTFVLKSPQTAKRALWAFFWCDMEIKTFLIVSS